VPLAARRFPIAAAAAAAVSLAGARWSALSAGGAAAAFAVGTSAAGFGGWRAGAALVAFFVSSSALSRTGAGRGRDRGPRRGSRRDAVQVLANGGVPALAATGMATPRRTAWSAAYYGGLASAAADTWATEVGRRSRLAPRRLLLGRAVAPGTSGGMTALGSLASVGGAAAVAAFAALDGEPLAGGGRRRFAGTLAAGVVGSLTDSVLGATIQEVRGCGACGAETERPVHCGRPTAHLRGVRGFGNDGVNAAATAAGAVVGWVLRDRRSAR
jgi:uncharacterized protein (TIGR00297 family)